LDYIACRPWLSISLIALLAFSGSAAVGLIAGIPQPAIHDEFSYLLAADTFAHGRLTNPTHPMWVHFESFHIIQQPTYMSKYPPAQGLILAAGQVIAGHPIVGVWLSFGLMCAAITWMLYAWVSPRWALVGGILAVIHPILGMAGYWAQTYSGGAVAATGGALVLGGMRRLMRRPRLCDALLTGAGLSVLANSRPYEGLLLSLPAGLFLFHWILRKHGPAISVSLARIVTPILLVLTVSAVGMSIYNLRVTGSAFVLPYQIHEKAYAVTPLFIWQKPALEPDYHHRTIREFHTVYSLPLYQIQHSIAGFARSKLYLLLLLTFGTMNFLVIPLMPFVGRLTTAASWVRRNFWAKRAAAIYFFFISGLVVETFMGLHYLAPIVPLNYFFALRAMRFWRVRNPRLGELMLRLLPILAAVLLPISLYGPIKQHHSSAWHIQRARLLKQMRAEGAKHLIIVRYGPQHSFQHEWVYNEADIDHAKVLWARSMEPMQNCQLVNFFKDRQVWSLEINDDNLIIEPKPYPVNQCPTDSATSILK
jgi:hypothetical protein